MRKCLKKFGINNLETVDLTKNNNSIKTLQDTMKERVMQPIAAGKKMQPSENYLVILLFACHVRSFPRDRDYVQCECECRSQVQYRARILDVCPLRF